MIVGDNVPIRAEHKATPLACGKRCWTWQPAEVVSRCGILILLRKVSPLAQKSGTNRMEILKTHPIFIIWKRFPKFPWKKKTHSTHPSANFDT